MPVRKPITSAFPLGAGFADPAKLLRLVNIVEQRLRTVEAYLEALSADLEISEIVEAGGTKAGKTFSEDPPLPVAASSIVGTSKKLNRSDHVHKGVTSVRKSTDASGPLIFDGSGVSQVGSTFTFPGLAAVVFGTPVDIGGANAEGASSDFVRKDHVHRGVLSLNRTSAVYGALTLSGSGVRQASSDFFIPGQIFLSTTQTGNTATVETDLFSFSIAGNTLSVNGDTIDFYAFGTFGAGVSADKQLRIKYGATTVFDSGALSVVSLDWRAEGQIIRTGAATQKAIFQVMVSGVAIPFSQVSFTSPTETLSGAVTLKVTGVGTNASDVVGEAAEGRLSLAA